MKLRAMFTENWGLKLLSLAFAILLWMFVVGEKRSEVSLTVPLELTRIPEDMVIVSPVPEAVRVRLSGPRTLMASADPDKLSITLRLDGLQPGISTFEILPSRLNLPRGMDVTYISPSVVTLEADRKVRRVLPVKPRVRGTPAEGFEVGAVRVEPPVVEVEGAERALQRYEEIPTEVVDVTGLDGGIRRPVDLALPDPTMKPVGRGQVQMEVEIRVVRAERVFQDVPVAVPRGPWQAVPSAVSVRLGGSVRALARLTAGDLVVAVEPFGSKVPAGPVRVVVTAPPEVALLEVEPNAVQIVPRAEPPPGPQDSPVPPGARAPDPGG